MQIDKVSGALDSKSSSRIDTAGSAISRLSDPPAECFDLNQLSRLVPLLIRLDSSPGEAGILGSVSSRQITLTVVANRDHLVAELSGETVILHVEKGVYYGLNKMGTRIRSLIQEPRTIDELVENILNEYEVEREQAERDVIGLVQDLAAKGLAEIG